MTEPNLGWFKQNYMLARFLTSVVATNVSLMLTVIGLSAHGGRALSGGKQHPVSRRMHLTSQVAAATRVACGETQLLRRRVRTLPQSTPVFINPKPMPVALIHLKSATILTVEEVESDWLRVSFNDRRWGNRVGYLHCASVQLVSEGSPTATKPRTPMPTETAKRDAVAAPSTTRGSVTERTPAKTRQRRVVARVNGYLEWRQSDQLIVEGQRITWDAKTKIRTDGFSSLEGAPLGAEVIARGFRLDDGSVLARDVLIKPNGTAMFEREILEHFRALEAMVISEGYLSRLGVKNQLERVGPTTTEGADYARIRRILDRLRPPYVKPSDLRVYVVDADTWNASAAANGAIFVHSALLRDVNDDELAVVLGHELAHYTHEHSRRQMKQALWRGLVAVGAQAAIEAVDDPRTQDAVFQLASIALHAWQNGYSRANEDQADRVGLRYAYEAGFDVGQAVGMWQRARAREGEMTRVGNFFWGSHSRPTERIRNVEQQIQLNYSTPRTAASDRPLLR